jgi:type I restriction enzyme S subunit
VSSRWLEVPLRSVLSRANEAIDLVPEADYRQVTVRMHHKGVTLRGIKRGQEIGSGRQYVARSGQLILSRIDARNGAIGLVPESLSGAIVTNDFWLFNVDSSLIDPKYLDHYVGTHAFIERCLQASEGTTNRVRLQPDRFLSLTIRFPSLWEQRRIVARIEHLIAKIEEARELRQGASEMASQLVPAQLQEILGPLYSHEAIVPLQSLCERVVDCKHYTPHYVDSDGYPAIRTTEVGFGFLNLQAVRRVGEEDYFRMTAQYAPKIGDVVYAREGNWGNAALIEGSEPVAISQRVMLFAPDRSRVCPRFLMWVLNSPQVRAAASERQRGYTAVHVNVADAKQLPVPVPSRESQEQIARYVDGLVSDVVDLRHRQAEARKAFSALPEAVLSRAFRGDL